MQRNAELNEDIQLRGCVLPLPGKMGRRRQPFPLANSLPVPTVWTDTPASVQSSQLSVAPASPAFDGAGGRAGGPLPATAPTPAPAAWLGPILLGGKAPGFARQQLSAGGQSRGSPRLNMGSRRPSHIPLPRTIIVDMLVYTLSSLRTLSRAIAVKTWYRAVGEFTALEPNHTAQIRPLHKRTRYLGQVAKPL